jgi:hypothetical protein
MENRGTELSETDAQVIFPVVHFQCIILVETEGNDQTASERKHQINDPTGMLSRDDIVRLQRIGVPYMDLRENTRLPRSDPISTGMHCNTGDFGLMTFVEGLGFGFGVEDDADTGDEVDDVFPVFELVDV